MGTWLITRPPPAAYRFARQVRARGHRAFLAPALQIIPTSRPNLYEMTRARWQGLVFTSAVAVRLWHAACSRAGLETVYAVGAQTAAQARRLGWRRIITPPPSAATRGGQASLIPVIIDHADPAAGPLIHPRNQAAGDHLVNTLQGRGYEAKGIDMYQAQPMEELPPMATRRLAQERFEGIFLFSAKSTLAFAALAPPRALSIPALCLSPAISQVALEVGFCQTLTAKVADDQAMLALMA